MTPREMNSEFIKIWDSEIRKRLINGEINIELDMQAILRSELERKKLIKKSDFTWRCYHDLTLLKKPENERFDLVLLKYKNKPERHYPAIVAEFKAWNPNVEELKKDIQKIKKLFSRKYPYSPENNNGFHKRPYACHAMYIVDLRSRKMQQRWRDTLDKLQSKDNFKVKLHIYNTDEANKILLTKTQLSQWCRYEGNKKGGINWLDCKKREIWQIRVTR